MKKKFILLALPLLLISNNLVSCNTSSSFNFDENIKTVRNYLSFLNNSKNYTLELTSEDEPVYTLEFEENAIAYSIRGESLTSSYFSGYIKDNEGIYILNLDYDYYTSSSSFIGGEYLVDSNNEKYTNLYDDNVVITLLNKFTFLDKIDEDATSYQIKDKTFLLSFITLVGYEAKDYSLLSNVICSFDSNNIFNIDFNVSSTKYNFKLTNIGNTNIKEVDEYLASNKGAYTPSTQLSDARVYLKANNYTRTIVDVSDNSFLGYELFNEHYFYSETTSSGYGSGWIGLESKKYNLSGSYSFTLIGTLDKGFTNIGLVSTPVSTSSDIPKGYHYPSYLKILNNIEYFNKGFIEIEGYTTIGETYYTTNSSYVYDFVSNFSIDQSFETDTYIPYGLAIDISINHKTSDKITFFYYLYYEGSLAVMNFEFSMFGTSFIDILDNVYEEYSD